MTFHSDVPQQADLTARLAPIRAHFLGTLGPRRDRLAAFCARPLPLPDPRVILELQEDAHKIRGVALTLGFDGLGRVAAQVDELLNPWLRSDQALPVGADHIAAFGDLLAAIDAALTSRP